MKYKALGNYRTSVDIIILRTGETPRRLPVQLQLPAERVKRWRFPPSPWAKPTDGVADVWRWRRRHNAERFEFSLEYPGVAMRQSSRVR